jgi:hypothetical protein
VADLRIRTLIALVYVCGRHVDPAFSMEDARRVRPTEIEFEIPDSAPEG